MAGAGGVTEGTGRWLTGRVGGQMLNGSVLERCGYMTTDQLSAVFGALADPTRRAILARLTEGDANVAELAAPFAVSQPAISRHLRVLEQAGLITRTRRATARLSHLEARPLQEVTQWLSRYRDYWDESPDAMLAELPRLEGDPADR